MAGPAQAGGYIGHTTNEVTIAVIVMFAIFGAFSVGFFAYFRYGPGAGYRSGRAL